MKRILVTVVFVCFLVLVYVDSFAKEMSVGEMRSIGSDSQIISVHFRGLEGRNCLVDVRAIKDGKEVFSQKIAFDWEREERYLSVGGKKMLIFYVVKGLSVYMDDKEI